MRDTILIVGMAFLTALAARAEVPWRPVPLTLQTIPVLLSGLLLGARRGYVAMMVYLAAGLLGLPVFAGGEGGTASLLGATGGYLVAFPLCALVMGGLARRGGTASLIPAVLTLIIGNAIILGFGAGWLSLSEGVGPAWANGVAPFLGGSVAKSVIVLACLPGFWKGLPGSRAKRSSVRA